MTERTRERFHRATRGGLTVVTCLAVALAASGAAAGLSPTVTAGQDHAPDRAHQAPVQLAQALDEAKARQVLSRYNDMILCTADGKTTIVGSGAAGRCEATLALGPMSVRGQTVRAGGRSFGMPPGGTLSC